MHLELTRKGKKSFNVHELKDFSAKHENHFHPSTKRMLSGFDSTRKVGRELAWMINTNEEMIKTFIMRKFKALNNHKRINLWH